MPSAYRYSTVLERVVDGDTIRARVDLGFYVSVTITIRVRGVDTPELHAKASEARAAALTAKNRTEELLMGKTFTVESFKDVQSFARWVCDVWLPDGRNLADVLIAEGLGVAA